MTKINNTLTALADRGYLEDLIPTRADNNKIPAISDWTNHKTSRSDIQGWETDQGIGLICRRVVAVDIDIEYSTKEALAIQQLATEILGAAPCRVGKEPKRLLVYRLKETPINKKILKLEKDGHEEKIEILGEKQHFVCYGTHPDTKQPYKWLGDELSEMSINDLTAITIEQLNKFLEAAESHLLKEGYVVTGSKKDKKANTEDRKVIGDQSLMASPELIKQALSFIPNNKDDERTEIKNHDELIPYAAAIKAALGGDVSHYSVYNDWMQQWDGNDEKYIQQRWDSIHDAHIGAEFIFRKAGSFGWVNPEPEWVKEFNQNHFVAPDGKDTYVFQEVNDPIFNGRRTLHCHAFTGFKKLHDNKQINVSTNGKEKYMGHASAWLKHLKRRTYENGLVFAPNKQVPDGCYNIWQGWGVKPKPGSWEQMKIHIRDVLCAGNIELFNYTIGWLANMVQKPDRQGEVAFVISGGKGVGKGTFGHYVGKFFGQHFLHVTNQKHLIGNFNHHLRDAVFVVLDEAFFAGDKKHESILKSIITEPVLMIEKKGIDAVQAPNYTHIMMFSNETWVVPASVDERRFFVIHIPSHRKPEKVHFDALYTEMDNGGPAAMLDYLLNYDLSDFDLRSIPQTEALIEQKLQSLSAPEKWLYSCLHDANIGEFSWDNERFSMPTQVAHEHYMQHHTKHSYDGKPLMDSVWSKTIRKTLYNNGNSLITDGGRPTDDLGTRQPHTSFPSLSDARCAFERYINGQVEWPKTDGTGVTLDDLLG